MYMRGNFTRELKTRRWTHNSMNLLLPAPGKYFIFYHVDRVLKIKFYLYSEKTQRKTLILNNDLN
jgi:hypothetical protein